MRHIFTEFSSAAVIMSMIFVYLMMAWEAALIPMILVPGILRQFGIWFGVTFFVVSLFVLQLGKLPHYELVLWGILFWPGWAINRGGSTGMRLLYDDRCNLCDRTVWIVTRLDFFNVIELTPISKNKSFAEKNGLSADDILNDMYGIDSNSNEKFGGYELYLELTKRLMMLFPLFPILFLGKLMSIGPRIYRHIAERRRAWFGVCEMPSIESEVTDRKQGESRELWAKNTFFNAYLAMYLFLLVVYVFRLPYLHQNIPGYSVLQDQFEWLKRGPTLHGQIPITVFTPNVLQMGTHYFTLTRVLADGREELVPYVGPNGERLEWVLKSDRVYFGHSLKWRRQMYGRDGERVCYEPERDDLYLKQLYGWSRKIYGEPPARYRVDFYHQGLANFELFNGIRFEQPSPEHVCVVEFSGEEATLIPGSLIRSNAVES